MKLSKKKRSRIETLSVYDGVLRDKGHTFTDTAPDFWYDDQKKLFDLVIEIEEKMRQEILKVLEK